RQWRTRRDHLRGCELVAVQALGEIDRTHVDVADREAAFLARQMVELEERSRADIEHGRARRVLHRAREPLDDRSVIEPPWKSKLELVVREVVDRLAHDSSFSGRRTRTRNSAVGSESPSASAALASAKAGNAAALRSFGKFVQREVSF